MELSNGKIRIPDRSKSASQNVYVVLNADKSPVEISLPASAYTAVVANGKVDENGLWSVRTAASSTVAVAPQSALIIHD